MKPVHFIICLTLCNTIANAQNDTMLEFGAQPIEAEYYFGFNLMPTGYGQLMQFGLVKPLPNGKLDIKFINKTDFIEQIVGHQWSPANPTMENLRKKYELGDIFIIEKLWKLRYTEYPYYRKGEITVINPQTYDDDFLNQFSPDNNDPQAKDSVLSTAEPGWAVLGIDPSNPKRTVLPSVAQRAELEKFGITTFATFCYGENFFNLLKKVQDSTWVKEYTLMK